MRCATSHFCKQHCIAYAKMTIDMHIVDACPEGARAVPLIYALAFAGDSLIA